MSKIVGAAFLGLLLAGCWADFPDSRYRVDGIAEAAPFDGAMPLDGARTEGFVPCSSSDTCNGYACSTSQGVCRTRCTSNLHCASGYLCNPDHACVQAVPCSSDDPCAGYECFNGTCRVSCNWSGHCAQGFRCQARECVPEP